MGFFDWLTKMFAGNPRHFHDMLGLAPDEDFKTCVACTLWRTPTAAENAEAVVLGIVGLFAGEAVSQVGVPVMAGVTTTGRLVVGSLDGKGEPLSFSSGSGLGLVDTGRKAHETVMGPTGRREPGHILSMKKQGGELFELIVAASLVPQIDGWS